MPVVQRRGLRALQIWCQRVTADYDEVSVSDLSSSFRDGLAFCAILHHFRPDLIDFSALKKEDVYDNNALAYRVAEDELGIPSLLDPQDMVDTDEPDKFSVVTYVSQYYHLFKDADNSRSPVVGGVAVGVAATPTQSRLLRNLSESEENDSLLQSSSSSDHTPLGTPTTTHRPQPRLPLFNQADLIAKYGEEIFSAAPATPTSPAASKFEPVTPTSPVMPTSPVTPISPSTSKFESATPTSPATPTTKRRAAAGGGKVAALCQDFLAKATVSEERRN